MKYPIQLILSILAGLAVDILIVLEVKDIISINPQTILSIGIPVFFWLIWNLGYFVGSYDTNI